MSSLPQSSKLSGAQIADAEFFYKLHPWRWWVGLTFEHDVSEQHADRAFRRWLDYIAIKVVRWHYDVAWVKSKQTRGAWHFHCVLHWPWNDSLFDAERGKRIWMAADPSAKFGKIQRYEHNPGRHDRDGSGAMRYMREHGEIEQNVICPKEKRCVRHGKCVEAPGPLQL